MDRARTEKSGSGVLRTSKRSGGQSMQLIFGQSADGRCYPDFAGGGKGTISTHVVGPNGLVDILETQLGLRGPTVPSVARIAACQAKLDRLGGERFWSSSFKADPWATAKLLLSWRDALVLAGWNAESTKVSLRRLQDLRDLERSEPATAMGLGDRLWQVIAALRAGEPIAIASVILIDDRSHLAPGLCQLVEALEKRGVVIGARPVPPQSTAADLSALQSTLRQPVVKALSGDGSVVDLVSQTELMLAEAVADWLLAIGEEGRASTVVIAEGGSTALLDAALSRRGLPKLGLSSVSTFRGALQILPLAMALQWHPFDPVALLDLLMLPRPPVGRFAASLLATALSREPGRGGRQWAAAWTRIEDILRKDVAAGQRKQADIDAQLEEWRTWTAGGQFDPDQGMPKAEAAAVAQRVIAWAVAADVGAGDPLLMSVVSASRALLEAIEASRRDLFPRLLIEAMVAQAIGDGVPDPKHVAEAGSVRAIDSAGAIWDAAERVVWFDFKDPGHAPAASRWDEEERAALATEGCVFETPAEAAARVSAHWARAAAMAGRQMIFARVSEDGGSEIGTHPLAHRLASVLGERATAQNIRKQAEGLLANSPFEIGGVAIERHEARLALLPVQAATWSVSKSTIARTKDRSETATSLEHLLACPLRWLLSDVLEVRQGRAHSIPRIENLIGNVAHALVQRLFPPGEPPDPAVVRKRVAEDIDQLAEDIAAPLLQPGGARDMASARRRIPESLAFLARHMQARSLRVSATEADIEGELAAGLKVHGRIDMQVELPVKQPAVIDFKWSGRDKYRREELEEGRAIQLAVYGRAVNGKRGVAPAGYYMLAQRKLLAEQGSALATETIEVARDLADTVGAIAASWQLWQAAIAGGSARATGISEDEQLPDGLEITPQLPCKFCDFKGLCRVGAPAGSQS